GATLTLLAPFARLASAAAKPDSRLVLVILRGGLDGLAAVPPYAEPEYAKLRGPIAIGRPGSDGGVLDLDGTFGLHPALTHLHALYRSGEALVVHAAATPYRDRSHFYAQNVLEAGSVDPSAANGGWLNRALAALHEAGAARDAHGAVALADSVPLVLRGDVAVASWAPSQLPVPDDDTLLRVRRLYEAAAPDLAQSLYDALEIRAIAGDPSEQRMDGRAGLRVAPLASAAARFLASPDGPRIAVLDAGGWDTHANQGGSSGPLAQRLRGLDLGLQTLQAELGTHWRETTVLVVTEFGRAAAVNGTRGTDHGTAGCAFAVGGAVAGGRVLADWPGLTARDLHDGRDLRPTTDLRALFKAVLHERFGVGEAALARSVFPASDTVEPLAGVTA
ncbi:MAG TPA: DUF1501 domain-containing protein, partial [Gammaproteobacteria bacterium]|nr:DUF1501 domain-containing protein [Gammaproteobacteria bacterium]